MTQVVDKWRIPAAPSAGLFLRLWSLGHCCSVRHQKVFCQTVVKRKKLPLKKPTCIPTNASKQSVCVCVCVCARESNSVCILHGCKWNYCGSLTERDLRKMGDSFTLKTRFRNIILGNTAALFVICCPGLLPHAYLNPTSPPRCSDRGAGCAAGEQLDSLPL